MAGAKHKQKGSRVERRVVAELRDLGFSAQRVPNSGSSKGRFDGDIHLSHPALGIDTDTAEVKARANGEGWKTIRAWMQETDMIFLVEDRKDPLVVLTWDMFQRVATALRGVSDDGRPTGLAENREGDPDTLGLSHSGGDGGHTCLDMDPILGGGWDDDEGDAPIEAGEH